MEISPIVFPLLKYCRCILKFVFVLEYRLLVFFYIFNFQLFLWDPIFLKILTYVY